MPQQFVRPGTCCTILFALMAACASSPSNTSVILQHPDYKRAEFQNVLVIAVAADYEARAQFERQMVSGIRSTGASATAYYTLIGRNPPVTRSDIQNAVRSRGFDAVLFTRVKDQANTVEVKGSAPEASATVRGGNVIDVFRYDYEEFNEPDRVEINSSVTLVTELYAASDEIKVWSVETTSGNHSGVGQLITTEVKSVLTRLRKDGMVGG